MPGRAAPAAGPQQKHLYTSTRSSYSSSYSSGAMNSGVPSTLCGAVRDRSMVASPRSPIFTTPSAAGRGVRGGVGGGCGGRARAQRAALGACRSACGSACTLEQRQQQAGAQAGAQLLSSARPLRALTRAVDEDVVALEVAVDDGRAVAVQVHQAAQDLVGPPLHHLLVNVLVPLAVPAGGGRGRAGVRGGRGGAGAAQVGATLF